LNLTHGASSLRPLPHIWGVRHARKQGPARKPSCRWICCAQFMSRRKSLTKLHTHFQEACMAVRRTRKDDGSQWTAADSRSVYGIRHWGAGHFSSSDAGQIEVRPQGPKGEPIEFNALIELLRDAGLTLPFLVPFPGILQDRVRHLTGAFDANIERLDYQGRYTALYPIKVNQQEAVIKNIIATQNVAIEIGRAHV